MRRRFLILCFHGFQIDDEAAFRPKLFMRDSVLKKRLDSIRRYGFPVLPLGSALNGLADGSLPDNALCITIDDGFYSVLDKALPLLKEYGMPATLYLTSYYIAKKTPIFRLVVQYIFWKTSAENLDLSDQAWGPISSVSLENEETRNQIIWDIIDYGEQDCGEEGRQIICSLLGQRLNIDYAGIIESRILSLMTPEELRALDAGQFDVQLHTHRHRLPTDSETECRQEIQENKQMLMEILGINKTHLCYPSGIWGEHQWPWLKEEGVESATTCEPGLNTSKTPLLALYRILDQDDLSQIEFEAELFGFSELIRIITGKHTRAEK